jgi:hypothetical protein
MALRVSLLGANIAASDPDIAEASQILERGDVHVRSPARETGVAKCVKVEGLDLPQFARFGVLLFDARWFDVPARGRGREQPCRAISIPLTGAYDRINPRRYRELACGVLRLSPGDLQIAVLHVDRFSLRHSSGRNAQSMRTVATSRSSGAA